MLDTTKLRHDLDAAVQRLLERSLALCIEHLARAQATASARKQAAAPRPAPLPRPKVVANPRPAAPKHRAPKPTAHGFRAPLVPVASHQPVAVPVRPKKQGPSPEKIAAGVLKSIGLSPSGFTADQLASSLRVASDALAPVLRQLADDQKVRAVHEGGTVVFRRPRIEPIRRRKDGARA